MWIEAPILKENLSSGGFFGGMYRRTYGSTDRRTDGQTDRKRGGGGMSDMSPVGISPVICHFSAMQWSPPA